MENNRKIKTDAWQDLYKCRTGQWKLAIVSTLLFVLITVMIYPITFTDRTNDDYLIMAYLAGYRTGHPSDFAFFVNPVFSKLVSFLYTISQKVYWYTYMHIVAIILSIVVISKCILNEAAKRLVNLYTAIFILLYIYFFLEAYLLIWLSFTTTPALMMTACMALLFNLDNKSRILPNVIMCSVLSAGAYLWRPESALVGLIFCFICVCYKVAEVWRQHYTKRLLFLRFTCCGFAILVVILGALFNNIMYEESYSTVRKYKVFNSARAAYMDYPHSSYDAEPALYDAIGIDKTLADLMKYWFFMDERINAENFRALSGSDIGQGGLTSPRNDILEALRVGYKTSREEVIIGITILFDFWIYSLCASWCIVDRSSRRELFVLTISAMVSFVLCFYLCMLGRFVLRAFQCVAIPYNIFCALLVIKSIKQNIFVSTESLKLLRGVKVYLKINCLIAIVLYSWVALPLWIVERKFEIIEINNEINNIAIHDNAKFFIYDDSRTDDFIDAFPNFDKGLPVNLIHWGGWVIHSPVFEEQLRVNGRENLDAGAFLEEKTYFITTKDTSFVKMLHKYLIAIYGNVTYTLIDLSDEGIELKYLQVYQFRLEN